MEEGCWIVGLFFVYFSCIISTIQLRQFVSLCTVGVRSSGPAKPLGYHHGPPALSEVKLHPDDHDRIPSNPSRVLRT